MNPEKNTPTREEVLDQHHEEQRAIRKYYSENRVYLQPEPTPLACPDCGGLADNGHDRELPPNPYTCSKCENYDLYNRRTNETETSKTLR